MRAPEGIKRRMRGRPLVMLVAVLGIWISLRVVAWENPDQNRPDPLASLSFAAPATAPLAKRYSAKDAHLPAWRSAWSRMSAQFVPASPTAGVRYRDLQQTGPISLISVAPLFAEREPALPDFARSPRSQPDIAAGRSSFMQAFAPFLGLEPAAAPYIESVAPRSGKRWRVDSWVLWRSDTGNGLAPDDPRTRAAPQPSYGRSQAGAVARLGLAPQSGHRPQVYARVSTVLDGEREREVAAGVAARPLSGVPISVAAEARLTDTAIGTQVRAAGYAVSEFSPVALPAGMTGEAYVQAGYVAGEFSTAFVDGQARVTREVAALNGFSLSAGGGLWGGAQEGAERLDIGPSAALNFQLGDVNGRFAADYRVRVAGDAAPDSGPAITLTAGF